MSLQQRIRSSIRDVADFPKPGILFKDITPVLVDPVLCKDIVDSFYDSFKGKSIDSIIGIESRGFIFGMMLAQKFNVPFIPVRKHGKLPSKHIPMNTNSNMDLPLWRFIPMPSKPEAMFSFMMTCWQPEELHQLLLN